MVKVSPHTLCCDTEGRDQVSPPLLMMVTSSVATEPRLLLYSTFDLTLCFLCGELCSSVLADNCKSARIRVVVLDICYNSI